MGVDEHFQSREQGSGAILFGPAFALREQSLPAIRCSRLRRTRTARCRPEANARFWNVLAEGHRRRSGGSVLISRGPRSDHQPHDSHVSGDV